MSSAVDLKTKEEKDAELDRRIEALRKKNEALVKRYQEIEEDKKKAEQEGIAVTTPRKPRPHEPETDKRKTEKENFTVTVDLSKQTGDKRVVNDWKPGTPRGRKTSEESDGHRGGPNDGGHRGGPNDGGHRGGPNDGGHRGGPNDGGHRGGPNDGGHRGGAMDSGRWSNDCSQRGGPSDSHSPPRRAGSGRMGRGGQRGGGGGRQERREWEPRTPKDGEPGESGGSGRRGGRRGRGRGGGGTGGGGGEGEAAEGGVGTPGGAPGGADRKSKEWEEKRRQNIEKMNEEMEQIAEYEKGQRPDGDKPLRNFLDDPRRSGPAPDMDRKEGSRRHVRNWGGLDFDNVKTRAELEKEWTSRRPGPKGSTDMTMSMTGRERAEYLSWKKEREQIDEDRLARHRNATGQWRREWDAQKTENMFKEDQYVSSEGTALEQPSRRARGRNFRTDPRGRASDDNKRPPKTPTFGDFLSQGRSPGQRGEQGGGRGRGPRPTYSMHDNRWEGDKEEEKEKKDDDDKTKREKTKKKKKEEKAKPSTVQKAEPKNATGEDDDDEEWEDASDGEEDGEGSDLEHNSRGDEKKDTGREKAAKVKDDSPTSPPPRSRPTSAESPKDQRPPRPKVHIPPPAAVHDSPEGAKPLSPFFPLESHQPVSDWGEEMEMLSPRSSMGGESPLKPPSVESSPPQKKEEEERKEEEEDVGERKTEVEERKEEEEEEVVGERETEEEKEERKEEQQQEEGERKKEEEEERKEEEEAAAEIESKDVGSKEPAEPQEEVDADVSCPLQRTEAQQTVILSEPEAVPTDSPVAPPSDAAPSEVSCPAHSEVTEASVTVDQNTPAAPPQEEQLDTPPSSAAPQDGDGSSEPEGEKDDDAAAAACTAKEVESSEQTSSG
uniref:Coiled-coil domain containing 9 n=1 Tax=Gasterosteus aculeatus aculeatus TaxID=481459 RepID=A0AAQ4NZG2_GASAC|nr:coiled-coil domain-containing protein 9 isoform X3 [Gasterosteus aculeatus aculeatus]